MNKSCKQCGEEVKIPGTTCRVCKDGIFRYGLNRKQQLELHESQNGQCLLCDSDVKMFDGHKGGLIDHHHETGKVRGILCNRCNTIIGSLERHKHIDRLLNYLDLK